MEYSVDDYDTCRARPLHSQFDTAGFIKNGSFCVHTFNEHYQSIPHYTDSWTVFMKQTVQKSILYS